MNKLRMTLVLPALAALALSLSSCSGEFWIALGFGITPDISGKVVDARGLGTSFSGATVTLTNIDKGNVYHATVDSSGNWSVGSAKSGHYTASVSASGNYFFTSTTSPFYYSGSGSVTAPTLAGLYTGDFVHSNTTYIAFVLMWSNSQELDLHFTGPDIGAYTFPSIATLDFTSPDYSPSYDQSTAFVNAWNGGFGPNGSASSAGGTSTYGRLTITNSNRYLTVGQSSTQVGLATYSTSGYGPDTIMFYNYPTPYTPGTATPYYGFNITGSSISLNQLPYAASYWGGVGEIYIDAPAPNYISTSSSTTNATLYAVTADSSTGNPVVLGVYTVPTNTPAATLAAVRLNIMDNQIQLVPQMQVVTPEYYRSAAGTNGSGVVSIRRGSDSK